jgi:ubiquinone biosynthesis protein COQ9
MTAKKHATPSRDDLRRELLAATLRHVPFDGWTIGALAAGGRDLEMDLVEVRRLFPGGAEEAIDLFVAEADRRMVEELERLDLKSMRIRERIATAVRVRLEQQAPHREAIRKALAQQIMPQNGPGAVRGLARTVDLMWRMAGDDATDFNWYTKRFLLAGVYSSTVLYWLNDKSEDFAATWAFLDRRIEDIMRIQKTRARVEKVLPNPDRLVEGGFARVRSRRA